MFGLSQIQLAIIGGLLAAVLTVGGIAWIYDRGETAGADSFKAKTAAETVRALDAARAAKDKADAKVRSMPYGEKIDGLR